MDATRWLWDNLHRQIEEDQLYASAKFAQSGMSKQDIVAGIEKNEELFTMIVSTDPNKRDGLVGGVAFHKDKVLNARAKSNDRMDFIIQSTDHSRLRMTDDSGTCFVFFCRNVGVALVSYR